MTLRCPVAEHLRAQRPADYEALRRDFGLPDYAARMLDGRQVAPGAVESLALLERLMQEPPRPGRAGEGPR